MVYSMSSRINVILSPDRNGMIVPYIIEKEGRYYRVDDVKQIRIPVAGGNYLETLNFRIGGFYHSTAAVSQSDTAHSKFSTHDKFLLFLPVSHTGFISA